MFSRKSKTSVGLDIGSSLIKVVEVDHTKDAPVLTKYGIVKLPPEAIVEGEVMDQSLVVQGIQEAMAKAGVTAKDVVTAVSGRAVIVKKVVMDKMNPDDAKEAIFGLRVPTAGCLQADQARARGRHRESERRDESER